MSDPSSKFGAFGTIRDLKHDRELAAALGDMIVAWSDAERSLMDIVVKLTGMAPTMAVDFFAQLPSFDAKIKLVRTLIFDWAEDGEEAVEAVIGLSRLGIT